MKIKVFNRIGFPIKVIIQAEGELKETVPSNASGDLEVKPEKINIWLLDSDDDDD